MDNENTISPLDTLYSLNDNYKAIVAKAQSDFQKFEVNIYKWNEDEVDEDGRPTWERIFGPLVLETQDEAVFMGKKQLEVLSGEMEDLTIKEDLAHEFTEILGHEEFKFLKPENFEAILLDETEENKNITLKPSIIAAVEDFYFMKCDDQWVTGFLFSEGHIHGWKTFKTIKEALLTILND